MSLQDVSDEELLASLPRGVRNRNPGNIEDGEFARSLPGYKGGDGRFAVFDSLDSGTEAQARLLGSYGKRGINTVEGVVNRWAPRTENNTDAYIRFVSQKIGVDPREPLDMEDAATLSALAEAMAEHENGVSLRAPDGLADVSDEELLASLDAPREVARSESGGVTIEVLPPEDAAPPMRRNAEIPMKSGAKPSFMGDVLGGFAQPLADYGRDLVENYKRNSQSRPMPRSFGEFIDRTMGDIGESAGLVTGAMNLASAPARAAARPAARALSELPVLPTKMPELVFDGGVPRLTDARKMTKDETMKFAEGAIVDALSAARPTKRVPAAVKATKPPTLDELRAASDQAWAKVDASGYRFPKTDVQTAAKDIAKLVDDAGPELYPESARIVRRIEELAKRGDLTPAQANRLRSQVGEKLLQPGSTEASVGGAIKARIDQLIDNAADPNIKAAREVYTRLKKVEEVAKRAESANLRAESTYSGGNKTNATRQNLRPLIDPKSPQRMRNLTPDETKALRSAVRGTPTQNALRLTGKMLDPRGLLGAAVQTAAGIPSGGATLVTAAPGMAATELSNVLAAKTVDKLIDLMAVGGSKAALSGPPLRSLVVPGVGAIEALQLPEQLLDGVPLLRPKPKPAAPDQSKKR